MISIFSSQLYYQIEPEVGSNLAKSKALVDLLDEIVEEPLFNQLRYGKVIFCGVVVAFGVHALHLRSQFQCIYICFRSNG